MAKRKEFTAGRVLVTTATSARPNINIHITAAEADMLMLALVRGPSWSQSGELGKFCQTLYDALRDVGVDDDNYKGAFKLCRG